MNENERKERIQKHRADMPAIHRKMYDRAISGRSHKAAIKIFCLECVCWQKEEVRLCTSLVCPLYSYRPYKIDSKQAAKASRLALESKN